MHYCTAILLLAFQAPQQPQQNQLPPIILKGLAKSGGNAVAILEISNDKRFVRKGDEITLVQGAAVRRFRVAEIGKDAVMVQVVETGQTLAIRMGAEVKPNLPADGVATNGSKSEAWVYGQDFVKERLRSPSTASFGSLFNGTLQDPETAVTELGGGKYRVSGWVDSQNALGATVRADFVVTIQKKGDRWVLVGEPLLMQR